MSSVKLILISLSFLLGKAYGQIDITNSTTSANHVAFIWFTPNGRISLNQRTVSNINPRQPTIVIVQGWLSGQQTDGYLLNLTNAYANQRDRNVIYVDWNTNARYDYIWEVYSTISSVGQSVGEMLTLLARTGVNITTDLHLIGFSLGAHICGYAARYVRNQRNVSIHRITGLDPSGAYFTRIFGFIDNPLSLNRLDADIVDVTHTNSIFFGINEPLGTVDFYVNGGESQPFCGNVSSFDVTAWAAINTCSSSFATRLYTLSLGSSSYRGSSNPQTCSNLVTFGERLSPDATGTYYIRTANEYPFNSVC